MDRCAVVPIAVWARAVAYGVALLTAVAAPGAAQETLEPERQLGVKQGPETVFSGDVAALVPALAGAVPTGTNGRVGNELVFWGYRLADGRNVDLYACALLEGVDCDRRRAAICEAAPNVLAETRTDGDVRRLTCRNVVVAAPGEMRPGCQDREEAVPLAVGLVQCP